MDVLGKKIYSKSGKFELIEYKQGDQFNMAVCSGTL